MPHTIRVAACVGGLLFGSCGAAHAGSGFTYGNLAGASLGIGGDMNGAVPFPADNPWNTDISSMPVDPNSDNLIASIGLATGLHPDFGRALTVGRRLAFPM